MPWSDVSFHLKALEEKGYVRIYDKFIDNSLRKVVEMLPNGMIHFRDLLSTLIQFIKDPNSINAYIDTARRLIDGEIE